MTAGATEIAINAMEVDALTVAILTCLQLLLTLQMLNFCTKHF